jgi:ABC-type amino acid transport system permease subunit
MAIIHSCYYFSKSTIEKDMKFLLLISNAFINTMGITQPSPQAANRAAWFIVIMLTAVIAAVATIAILAVHLASNH